MWILEISFGRRAARFWWYITVSTELQTLNQEDCFEFEESQWWYITFVSKKQEEAEGKGDRHVERQVGFEHVQCLFHEDVST